MLWDTDSTLNSSGKGFKFPSLKGPVVAFLWRRKADLESAIRSLKDGSEGGFCGSEFCWSSRRPVNDL